jgi:hypothetical protein
VLGELVRRQSTRSRIVALFGGGTLIAVGAVLVVVIAKFTSSMGRLTSPQPEELFPMLGGAVLVVLGALWLALAFRRPRAMALTTPVAVAKAYVDEVTRVGAGVYDRRLTLVIVLATGKRIEVLIGRGHDQVPDRVARTLIGELAARYPGADIGWSQQDSEAELAKMVAKWGPEVLPPDERAAWQRDAAGHIRRVGERVPPPR